MERIRLLLLDDHVLFRESLGRLLASEEDFELAGGCGTTADALALLERKPVDVILLDFDLGDDHGSQFLSAARRAGFHGKVLMVTAGMTAEQGPAALLTDREQQVLRCIFEGLSNKEIAARIAASESAVKATLQQLFHKTRVRTRSQLVRIALETSLGARK